MSDEIPMPPMTPGLMDSAVECLREATTNRDAIFGNIGDAGRSGETYDEQAARLEDADQESRPTRRAIEDVAIRVVGDVYRDRLNYCDIVEAIKTAEAGWLYSVILERALEAVDAEA